MKILIFDCEGNSLDTANGFIQELAWAIYDPKTWRCLTAQSHLINWPTAYDLDPGALAVTGLTREFCAEFGDKPGQVLSRFALDAESCDYICGHNMIGYDYPMLNTNFKRALFYDLNHHVTIPKMLKIDTLIDCPFPAHMKVHALKYLAYDHGYILSDAHQALADVFACKHILSRYDFNQVIEIAKTPVVTLSAKIDFNDINSRDRVKNQRFYWNPARKVWEKRIREFYLTGIQLTLGSDVELTREI